MDQEKFGKLIKEIRKKHNLTQKQLAEKYNVTYQAVSKWENGKNMPDTYLIKQISEDFGISMEEMFEGKIKSSKNNKTLLILITSFIIVVLALITIFIFLQSNNNNFQFKTLSSECEHFTISGTIAYNDQKSSIYITNIKYCGGDDTTKYETIDCTLYESSKDIEKKISSYNYNEEENITLEEFLQNVTLTIDNYQKTCKEYTENSLYLLIDAKDSNNHITSHKIPLSLANCSN